MCVRPASATTARMRAPQAVEEAEGFKSIGNKKFKEADYAAAAGRYEQARPHVTPRDPT